MMEITLEALPKIVFHSPLSRFEVVIMAVVVVAAVGQQRLPPVVSSVAFVSFAY